MKQDDNSARVANLVDEDLCRSLKEFRSFGKGSWLGVSDSDWQNWKWQMRNRITSRESLLEVLPKLSDSEQGGMARAAEHFSMALTPYLVTLLDPENADCPLRREFIPRKEEEIVAPQESPDPCGEESYTVVPGLIHRYPDRVLLMASDVCPAYCRYCTRSRLVNQSRFEFPGVQQFEYIKKHPEIRDVLVSGGDPFLLSENRLCAILEELRKIPHVEIIRIGTRVPITLPQRITAGLASLLKCFAPLYINIQTNHPRELTVEAREALETLADAGIPLGNQSVLLRGVNDSVTVMKALVQKLLMCRVRPYYLYQCDLINGTSYLRVPLERGVQIIRSLKGFTSGFAVPEFVVDIPNGGGKTPVMPDYIVGEEGRSLVIRNFEGRKVLYPKD